MNRTIYRTTPLRCVDCGDSISEGPRCVPCARSVEEVPLDDVCENCEKVLVGSERRWAEDNDSPFCRRCAENEVPASVQSAKMQAWLGGAR